MEKTNDEWEKEKAYLIERIQSTSPFNCKKIRNEILPLIPLNCESREIHIQKLNAIRNRISVSFVRFDGTGSAPQPKEDEQLLRQQFIDILNSIVIRSDERKETKSWMSVLFDFCLGVLSNFAASFLMKER